MSIRRRLSGNAKVYQRISPRRTELLPTLSLPREPCIIGREFVRGGRRCRIRSRCSVLTGCRSQRELGEPHALVVGQLQDQRPEIAGGERVAHQSKISSSEGRGLRLRCAGGAFEALSTVR